MLKRSQKGATLIEVLVSMVILTIGLLGSAGLLVSSLKNLSEQSNAGAAASYARELGERIMANRAISSVRVGANPYVFDSRQTGWPAATTNCFTTMCTAIQRAEWDVADFATRIQNAGATGRGSLPNVSARICFDSLAAGANEWNCTPGVNSVLVVKIGWDSRDPTGNQANPDTAKAVYVISPGGEI
jgi:type IV pilus assembly protein PilV